MLDVLLEENIIADCLVGVSAGISFGVSYASRQIGRNRALAETYMPDKRYMSFRHMLNRKERCYYNLDFVFDRVPNELLPFDYDTFEKFGDKVYGGVTDIETGKPEYLRVDGADRKFNVLRASCALPILFPIIEINGKKYMDGGISDSIPYKKAMAEGCDKIIVVLTREDGYIKRTDKVTKLSSFIYRKYPEFAKALLNRADMYNAECAELKRLESEGRIFVVRPDAPLGIARTENRPQELLRGYDCGIDKMKRLMNKLQIYLKNQ